MDNGSSIHQAMIEGDDKIYAVIQTPQGFLSREKFCDNHRSHLYVMLQLKHKNVIEPSYCGINRDGNFMLFFAESEKVQTLQQIINDEDEKDPHDPEFFSTITKGLECGLEYIHSQDFALVNISAESILVNTSGTPKFTNFWEAKRVGDSEERKLMGADWDALNIIISEVNNLHSHSKQTLLK